MFNLLIWEALHVKYSTSDKGIVKICFFDFYSRRDDHRFKIHIYIYNTFREYNRLLIYTCIILIVKHVSEVPSFRWSHIIITISSIIWNLTVAINNPKSSHLITPVMSSSKIEIWLKLLDMACILWTRTGELIIK